MQQVIYKEGGRKFVMLTLAPLGCVPSVRALNFQNGVTNGSCMEELTNKAKMFNLALPKMLKQLENQLPGFKYTIFNFFKVFADSIHNPKKYGMFYLFQLKVKYFNVIIYCALLINEKIAITPSRTNVLQVPASRSWWGKVSVSSIECFVMERLAQCRTMKHKSYSYRFFFLFSSKTVPEISWLCMQYSQQNEITQTV